jgi:hypothetical protein
VGYDAMQIIGISEEASYLILAGPLIGSLPSSEYEGNTFLKTSVNFCITW